MNPPLMGDEPRATPEESPQNRKGKEALAEEPRKKKLTARPKMGGALKIKDLTDPSLMISSQGPPTSAKRKAPMPELARKLERKTATMPTLESMLSEFVIGSGSIGQKGPTPKLRRGTMYFPSLFYLEC